MSAITNFKTPSREDDKTLGDGQFCVQLSLENRANNFGGTFDRSSFEIFMRFLHKMNL